MTGKLVINADDLGLSRAATAGVVRGHLEGVVTSASLVTTTTDYEHAIATCRRECPDLGLGLHFTLSAGRPQAQRSRVSRLVDRQGFLRSRFGQLLWSTRFAGRAELLEQIAVELEAQLDRLAVDDVECDHIDSERHVHQIPGVLAVVARAALQRGIPWIRLGREVGWRLTRARHLAALLVGGGAVKSFLLGGLSWHNRRSVRKPRSVPNFASYLHTGRIDRILDDLLTGPLTAVTEVMVHPGVPELHRGGQLGNPALDVYLASEDRKRELEACIAARRRVDPSALTTFGQLDFAGAGER